MPDPHDPVVPHHPNAPQSGPTSSVPPGQPNAESAGPQTEKAPEKFPSQLAADFNRPLYPPGQPGPDFTTAAEPPTLVEVVAHLQDAIGTSVRLVCAVEAGLGVCPPPEAVQAVDNMRPEDVTLVRALSSLHERVIYVNCALERTEKAIR